MRYRTLGASGLRVSAIGFGGWPMGGLNYGAADDAAAIRAVHAALDAGLNLFDTAAGYGLGHSEQVLGRALGGRRADVVVVSKTGIEFDAVRQRYVRDSRPATIRAQCEASLAALGTDYLDVYLIHWPDFDTPMDETMGAMAELVESGKVRHVGVSNFNPTLLDAARAAHPIVANQVGYHLLDRRNAEAIIPYCRDAGIGVMAYGSLAHGVLSGAFTGTTTFDDDDWRAGGYAFGLPLFRSDHLARNVEAVEAIRTLAAPAGLTLPQLALRWVLREPAVATALVGCRSDSEVAAAVAAVEAEVADDLLGEADAIARVAYDRMRADEQATTEVGPLRRSDG